MWHIIVIFTSLMIGCTGITDDKRETAVNFTLYNYQTAIRWSQWDAVIGLRSKNAPPIPNLPFEDVKVTAYEILQPPVFIEENRMLQVAQIQYIRGDEQVVRKVLDKQDWHYDVDNNTWLLYNPFPDFK